MLPNFDLLRHTEEFFDMGIVSLALIFMPFFSPG